MVNIDNITNKSFDGTTDNYPQTSDDNVLNKLDGFYDDTRLLGIELTLKALSNSKINKKSSEFVNGSAAATGSYVELGEIILTTEITNRNLVVAIFDNTTSSNVTITCKVEADGSTQGRAIRYNGDSGGGAVYAFEVDMPSSTRRLKFYASGSSSAGNLRVAGFAMPL